MKPFLPFLLIPVLGLCGWGLSSLTPAPAVLALPTVPSLDAPPALGVAPPPPPAVSGPVHVSLGALLPMLPTEAVRVAAELPPPRVDAILVIGQQRLAQVNGVPRVIGDSLGGFRIAEIEADRVLFVQTTLGNRRWVPLNDR